MKKINILLLCLLFFCQGYRQVCRQAYAESQRPSQQQPQQNATDTSATAAKQEKENIAIADFTGKNVSQADASIVTDFLRTEFVNIGLYTVIEKANMDKILAEAAFQQAGCTTSECAVQIGKILNVKKMVVGSLSKLEGIYYLTASIVDVETGRIENSKAIQCETSKGLMTASGDLANQLVSNKAPAYKQQVRETRRAQEPAGQSAFGLPLEYQTGHIVSTDDKEATIDLGYLHGVRKYQQFSLLKGEEKVNPATGEKILASAKKFGWLIVDELTGDGWTSKAKIVSLKKGIKINEGDIVKMRKESGYLSVETSLNKEGVEECNVQLDWKFPSVLRINSGFNNTLFMSSFAPFIYTRLSLDWRNFEIGIGPAVMFSDNGAGGGFASVLRIGGYEGVFNLIGRSYVCFGKSHQDSMPYSSSYGYDNYYYYYYDDLLIMSEGEMNIKPSDKLLIYFRSVMHAGYKYDEKNKYNVIEFRYLPCLGLKIGLGDTVNLDIKGGGGIYTGRYEFESYDSYSGRWWHEDKTVIDSRTSYFGLGLEFVGSRVINAFGLETERNKDTGKSLVSGRYKVKYKF